MDHRRSASLPEASPAARDPGGASPWRWRALDVALIVIVLAVALTVRVAHVDAAPSLDELWHLGLSTGNGSPLGQIAADVVHPSLPDQTSIAGAPPFCRVWTRMDGVLHPPLYPLTLRLWRDAFGGSDPVAHAYSIAWSLVAVGFVFALVRLAADRWLAALAALAFGVARTQVYFAQEVRGYAMLIALAAMAAWIATRVEVLGPTRRRAVALAACALPLLLTHYFAAGFVLGLATYGACRLRGHRLAFACTLAAAAAVYIVAWGPFALRQVGDIVTGDEFLRVAPFDATQELLWLATAAARLMVDADVSAQPATLLAASLFALPWLLWRRMPALLPWAMLLAATLGTLCALDVARSTRHLMFIRYAAAASPLVLPLAVGCAWAFRRTVGHVVGVVLLLVVAGHGWGGPGVRVDSPTQARAARWLAEQIAPGEALVVYHQFPSRDASRPFAAYADMLLLSASREAVLRDRPVLKLSGPLTRPLADRLPGHAWLILGAHDAAIEALAGGARVLAVHDVPGEATLVHVRLRDDVADPPASRPGRDDRP